MKPWTKNQRKMVNALYGMLAGSVVLYVALFDFGPRLLEDGFQSMDAVFIGVMLTVGLGLAKPEWTKQALGLLVEVVAAWRTKKKNGGS